MNIKGANGIMRIQPRPGRSMETPRIMVASDLPVFPIYHLVMTNRSPWKITMLLIGKPSIFMGHLYHGYVN